MAGKDTDKDKEKNGIISQFQDLSTVLRLIIFISTILVSIGVFVLVKPALNKAEMKALTKSVSEMGTKIEGIEKEQREYSEVKIHTEYVKAQVVELKGNMDKFQVEMKGGIESLKRDINREVGSLRGDIKGLARVIMRQHGG